MPGDDLNVLSAFLAVAEGRSFTKAARRLGVSPSALSHSIRGLEERIGVRLLSRTTRSVAPTEAGEQLISHLRPALGDIAATLEQIAQLRDTPAGHVRLAVSPVAARVVLAPKLARFTRDYPNVVLDVTTTAVPRVDLVAGGFDAGIRLGEFIERDMIAVRVSRDQRAAIVGAPRYFESHATPLTPNDLTGHPCINFRQGAEGLYRWEFDKGDQSITVAVRGPLVTEDTELIIRAAIEGVGLAFAIEEHVLPYLASGVLVRVLEDWSAPFPGYFLYYPSRRQQPAALAALVDTLRLS
jgi:DNA-binding transcriptional LysR family regulator